MLDDVSRLRHRDGIRRLLDDFRRRLLHALFQRGIERRPMEFGGVSNSQKNIPKRINNVSKDGKQSLENVGG